MRSIKSKDSEIILRFTVYFVIVSYDNVLCQHHLFRSEQDGSS